MAGTVVIDKALKPEASLIIGSSLDALVKFLKKMPGIQCIITYSKPLIFNAPRSLAPGGKAARIGPVRLVRGPQAPE